MLLAATLAATLSLGLSSKPDTLACCRDGGVVESCAQLLCRAERAPSHMEVFSGDFKRCSTHLPVVAACLADGRNHLGCCQAEAERPESACFDLCQGTAPTNTLSSSHMDDSSYVSYMSCLAFNIHTIYKCFRKGYDKAPTPPRALTATAIHQTSVELEWEQPLKFPEIVDTFHLYYKELLPGASDSSAPPSLVSMNKVSTQGRSRTVDGLSPNTRYSVYAVSATDHAERLSLPSLPARFVTKGLPPQIQAFPSPIVKASRAVDQILVCKIGIRGLERPKLQIGWSKKVGEAFEALTHSSVESDESLLPKYSQTAYQSRLDLKEHSRTVITTLTVRAAGMDDYGTYLCSVNNTFGSVNAELTLSPPRRVQVPGSPLQRSECGGALGIPGGAGSAPDASDYLANRSPSIFDILGLLSCAVKGRHNAGCCLRRQVPERCLSLCDEALGGGDNGGFQLFSCLPYSSAVFQCDMEAKAALPAAPRGLHAFRDGPDLLVRWEPVPAAQRYHLYYSRDGGWNRETVDSPSRRLVGEASSTLTLAVIAEGRAGVSGPSHALSWPQPRPRDLSRPSPGRQPQKLRLVAGKLPILPSDD